MVCLEKKTEVQEISLQLVKSIGVGRFLEWRVVEAMKSSSGMVVFEESRVLTLLEIKGEKTFIIIFFLKKKSCKDGFT